MFTATKIESTIRPEVFESLNNGIWYYNYDITKYTVKVMDMDSEEEKDETRYSYIQVRISGKPTLSKCVEAILKQYVNEEKSTLYDVMLLRGTNDQIDDIYYNIQVDFGIESPISKLDQAKKEIIRKIDEYDTSVNVNSFKLNDVNVWLSKDTRVGLMNSISIEKAAGKEQSVLWFNSICVTINCDSAIQMLRALELYALDCYNTTAEHKVNVQNLSSIEEVHNYDYTQGYPSKLEFTI